MRQGGGSQYDMVSASGDASLRLIRGGDVQPVNVDADPGLQGLHPAAAVAAAQHGRRQALRRSRCSGARTRCSTTRRTSRPTPTSWAAIYDPQYKGKVTVPDNPIQIADAALYLSKKDPSLGITDPYELTEKQLDAAVDLLKQQRPLIKKYWALASDEIDLFKNGDAVDRRLLAVPDDHAAGRQGAGEGPDPDRGRDRLGRHVDAVGASRSTRTAPTCG